MLARWNRQVALGARKRVLLGSSACLPLALGLFGASPALAQAVNLRQAPGNLIVPTGRTATQIGVSGHTTTISTSTMSGGNAYNSFSQFREGQGNTVNLIVPGTARNLVNVVTGGPVDIQGTLNSYKNGVIGGNVIFADSYGFIVGASGVINVGSLSVVTPTKTTLDQLIAANGAVDNALANQVIHGNVPISSDGSVVIRGQAVAQHGVRIDAHDVLVAGSVPAAALAARQRAQFESTVNAASMTEGGSIVVSHGAIRIVATNNVGIDGVLSAGGSKRHGGSIAIAAGANVTVGAAAKIASSAASGGLGAAPSAAKITIAAGKDATIAGQISAPGAAGVSGGVIDIAAGADASLAASTVLSANGAGMNSGGGTISVKPTGNLTVADGAAFDAHAGATGNGGFVELSAGQTATIGKIALDLTATAGAAGALLLDPWNLTIGGQPDGGTSANDVTVGPSFSPSLITDGASVILAADNSITINGTIDTRAYAGAAVTGSLSADSKLSTGNSGSITLTAPTITISSGGALYADVNNVTGANATHYTAGDVTLTATASDSESVAPSSATTGITIAGVITGAAVSAISTSTASTQFNNSIAGFFELPAGIALGALSGLNGGYVGSSATAAVTLQSTANIQATGAVTLSSIGSETASDASITPNLGFLQTALSAAVVVGKVSANVATEVDSGATISSGGALSVTSVNSANLSVTAQSYSTTTSVDAAVAYSTGSVNTSALVDSGAILSKAASVMVAAQNTNSFSTSSSANALGSGSASVALAISDITTAATANFGAALPTTAATANLSVYSGSNTTSNIVGASTTVGSNFLQAGVVSLVSSASSSLGSILGAGGTFDSTGAGAAAGSNGTVTTARGGITLALNLGTQSSTASIAGATSASAPTIDVSGDVAVISLLTDSAIRSNASSTINSSTDGTTANPTTSSAVSMAVNVDQITHTSDAFIGSDVILTAARIGVDAQTTVPLTNTWTDFDTFDDVTSHLNGNLGIVNNILTSYANATAESSTTGISGAVNYFQVTNDTTAWVASGASLTQNAAASSSWTSTIAGSGLPSVPTIDWATDVVVEASTTMQSINIGGNFSWLTVFGSNSTSSEGTAVGGSANADILSSNTIAGIGAGASVTANGDLAVTATTQDLIYAVAPTSGMGSGLGLNGIASVLDFDNTTSASISDAARIQALNVTIAGEQDVSSFDIAGAVGASKSSGVGIAVALATMSMSTSGFIGDNSSSLAASGASADDANVGATLAGFVHSNALSVDALTVGRLTTISVAAEFSNNAPDPAAPPAVQATQPSSSGYLSQASAFLQTAGSQLLQKLTTAFNNLTADNQNLVKGTNSVSGAGSASVDLTALETSATISSATIGAYSVGGSGNTVSVQALNNTIIDTASGAAAIAKGAPGTNYTVAIAGAVAVGLSTDMTTATITGGSVTADDITVQALAGGENTAIGLALSVTAGQATTSVAISASASIIEVNDGVEALVDSSTLGGADAGSSGTLSISADQNTSIGIGAGSLYLKLGSGNGGGGAVALTYAEIGDPANGDAVSAILSNSSVQNIGDLSLLALDQSRILSGAAAAGGGTDADGFAGSVVVNAINPTDLAEITGTPAVSGTAVVTGGIDVSGDVTVLATGGSNATLDSLISTAALSANGGLAGGGVPVDDSGLDFTGAALAPTSPTGAAILAVAGMVQVSTGGGSNVGVSLVVDNIAQTHEALIDRADVTSTGGVVDVSASDDAEILGIAFGVGAAGGSAAGLGSIVYNSIDDGVIAQIGHGITSSDAANAAAATVEAAAVSVNAEDGSTIRGATGAVSINFSGGGAVGLSATIDQISNYVSADIAGAKVTADEPSTDESPLLTGPLQAGSVVVSGQSDANILTIAIGVAISTGSSSGGGSPESSLASLVSALKPSTPSSLTGFGGGGSSPPASSASASSAPSTPSNGLSGAGSLAISTEATTVYSIIADGADSVGSTVSAQNNALVLASNSDAIATGAGALSISRSKGAGVGASVVVNEISGGTTAEVESSSVDAHVTGSAASIDDGALASATNPSDVAFGQDPTLTDGVGDFSGVAIVATSRQDADTIAAVFSASTSSTALSANSITNVMGGTTKAFADSSQLDSNLLVGEGSGVQVTASSASFANVLDLGGADSASSGAGTIVLVINTMDRTTDAHVTASTIGSSAVPTQGVGIAANAWEGTSGEAIGVAASDGYGVAGSALVNTFQADTEASLDHGSTYAASLSVTAAGTDGYFGAVGTAALGGTAGIGATVLVGISNTTTTATIGDASATPTATTIDLTGPLTVSATSVTDATSYVVGASVGGDGGGAAQVSATLVNNTTDAALDNSTVTITTATSSNADIDVASQETLVIDPVAGGLAGGGAGGVGASVNLVILKSDDSALMAGDTVTTLGAVNVTSLSTRDISPVTATAALGGEFGFAATVGVVLVGSGASSDAMSVLDNSATGAPGTGTLESSDQATSGSGADLTTEVAGGTDGISAEIIGGSVTAGSVDIAATGKMAVLNIVGALSVGLSGGGIGAAVGFTQVDQQVTAEADGGTIVTGYLTIDAEAQDDGSGHAARTIAAAGAGGLYVGLGAAVADSDVNNTVTAELGSTVNDGVTTTLVGSTPTPLTLLSTTTTVTANDSSSVRADAYGFAFGAAAVGASVAEAERDSSVTSKALADAAIASETVQIQATDSGQTWAYTLAGAGGIIAGDAAAATATDDATVTAQVMGGALIVAPNLDDATTGGLDDGLIVSAQDTPDAKAFSFGVSVGAAAVGVSYTEAIASPTVTATVDGTVALAGTVGLYISATSAVSGTAATSFPTSSAVPASTDGFEQGQTSAAAWSVAGAGGTLVGADATMADAKNDGDVEASTGTGLALPTGDVAIIASNTTNQFAQSTGVTVGGVLAIGVVVATAEAGTTTKATLGASASAISPNGDLSTLTVSATGTDSDNAAGQAGSGGFYAGNGSTAATTDDSTVTATVGAGSNITAASILIQASHNDDFGEMADSLNAGVVGASAALSTHDATSNVGVVIGAGADLQATAVGLANCLGSGCAPAIDITAQNMFDDASSGTQAGAGGGINGAGATSTINIDENGGGASIAIGSGVTLASGSDPNVNPGSIAVVASSIVFIADQDTLTTGGLIEGAGVNATVNGTLTNSETVGAGSSLTTFGSLDLGTYSTAQIDANGYVTTYGLAGVGDANAFINLTSNQTITVAGGVDAQHPTLINAFYNTNVTAGEYIDQGFQTTLAGDTNAESYVRGLIAVPAADANTTIASNATVDLAPQTIVAAGENVTIDAAHGSPVVASDGTGHGYELGFIPVTDGSNDTSAPLSSNVTLGGMVIAGEYHDLELTINPIGSATAATETSGEPVNAMYYGDFAVADFLTSGDIANLGGDISTSGVQAVTLGALFAAGGVVKIDADVLYGSGSSANPGTVTAYGSPKINVLDTQPIYLVLTQGAQIPDTPGGSILYSGAAGSAQATAAGITQNAIGGSGTPSITIKVTSDSGVGNSGSAPALLIAGDLSTPSGLLDVENDFGSYVDSGNVNVNQQIIKIPFGAAVFNANSPDGSYVAGGSAYTEFTTIYPGGDPAAGTPVGNDALQFVASSIFQRGNYAGVFTVDATGGTYFYGSSNSISTSGGTDINAALYGHAGNAAPNNRALVIFGACAPTLSTATCGGSYNIDDGTLYPNYTNPALTYTLTAASENTAGSAASQQIFGNIVSIVAATIDVNGSISVGPPTNFSVNISASTGQLLATLSQYQQDLADGQTNAARNLKAATELAAGTYFSGGGYLAPLFLSGQVVDISSLVGNSSTGSVTASYNTATSQITINKVNAFSSGANISLDGDIISTNTLGNIHINSGYGHFSLTNESGDAVVLNAINTGTTVGANATSGTITIIDRLKDQATGTTVGDTTTYIYNPVAGLAAYQSDNGANPLNSTGGLAGDAVQLALPGGSTGTSTTYSPVAGAAYQYMEEATLTRTVSLAGQGSASSWVFSGNTNSPWSYVTAAYAPYVSDTAPTAAAGLSSTAVGRVILGSSGAAFQETIAGDTLSAGTVFQDIAYVDTSHGFLTQADCNCMAYTFNYPTQAFLRITNTLKADNPFALNFSGNASGEVNVTSNAAVIFAAAISNPTGTTSVTASSGSISQTANGSLLANNVILSAPNGSIGSTPLPNGAGLNIIPIAVTLTTGVGSTIGALSAQAGAGGTYVNLASGAQGLVATASGGDVVVNATGTLATGLYGFTVAGDNVTVSSAQGAIGSAAAPLVIQTAAGGVANVSASGDIALTQPLGDLLIGQIASATGNVIINVLQGNVYDSLAQTSASSLSVGQVSAITQALHLVGANDADAGSAAITSFQNSVDSDLATYGAFLANGALANVAAGQVDFSSLTGAQLAALYGPLATAEAVQAARANQTGTSQFTTLTAAQIQTAAANLTSTNMQFALSAGAIATFRPQAAAALGIANPSTVTDAQVQAWANAQYQTYAMTFSQAYGATTWQSAVSAAPTSFTVASNSALATALTSSSNWTAQQLVQAVDVSALQPAATVVGSSARADIIGRDVTLNVVAGAVGTFNPSGVQISLSALTSGSLSTADQAILAVATSPGSVSLIGVDASGNALAAGTNLTNLPAGATVTALNISQTAPVFVDASGAFTVNSAASVYLQATTGSSITVNHVVAQGAVDLTAPGSIVAATLSGAPLSAIQINAVGDLDLVAGSGSIGSSATPLTYAIGGALVSASAGGDAYLNVVNGDARIQRDFAGGTASITTASGYSILSDLTGVNVEATNIVLNSGGAVGTGTAPLDILATGALSGAATGIANIDAPTVGGNAPNALTVTAFTAGGDVSLDVGGALTVATSLVSTNGAVTTTSSSLLMQSGASILAAKAISIDTSGDATLGLVESAFSPTTVSDAVTILAGGSILSNGDSLNLQTAANGAVSLTATTGIGTLSAPQVLSAPYLTADASAGDVFLQAVAALDAAQVRASGSVSLSGTSLILGSVTSGGAQTIDATGDIGFTTLTSTGGDIDATSTGGSITGGTLSANGSASLTSLGGNSGDSVTATNGSVTLAAGSLSAPSSSAFIDWTTVQAGTSLTATSGGALTFASATSGTTGVGGVQAIHASGAVGLTTATATGGALGVTSDASTVAIGSATSDGTQTIEGQGDVTFATLTSTAGDIDATSHAGSITGLNAATVAANGSASLTSFDGNSGDSVTATNGSVTLAAGSLSAPSSSAFVDWTTVLAGTSLTATSGGALTFASATSGTTGSGGVQAIHASGAVGLTTATATGGTVGITSDASTVTIGSATSDGTQTIDGQGDVTFATLTSTAGDIDATSHAGSITGLSVATIAANGSASLTAFDGNSGDSVTATNGSVTLAAGSLSAPSSSAFIDWTTVLAGTSLTATSGGALTLASATSGTTGSGGAQAIHASGAVSLTTATATGGALSVTSDASTVTIGSATSDGTQTIEGQGDVTFATLTASAGDIDVTSHAGSITGLGAAMIAANGSASLTSLDGNSGGSVTATNGSVTLAAGSLSAPSSSAFIDWTNVLAGISLTATSGGALTFASATSGDTQTLHATQDIRFAELTAAAGDVDATSDAGAIAGGSITAQHSANLVAATNNTGDQLSTLTGAAALTAGGLIDWRSISAATTINATSIGGKITLGAATSGGTQTLSAASDITFVNLTVRGIPGDAGDIILNSGGAILGGDAHANGEADFTAAGAISLGNLTASSVALSTPGDLTLADLAVLTGARFGVGNLRIGILHQKPNATGPLALDLTGYKGGIGNSAVLTVDALNGIVIGQLWEGDTTLATNASLVAIEDAFVTRTLDLTTASDRIWVNDQSSSPQNGFDVQLFQPSDAFYLTQNATFTTTNAFVVQYGASSAIVDQLFGNTYLGASFTRDFNRQGWLGNTGPLFAEEGLAGQPGWQFPVEAFDAHLQHVSGGGVVLEQPGEPAVAMGDVGSDAQLVSDELGFTIVIHKKH